MLSDRFGVTNATLLLLTPLFLATRQRLPAGADVSERKATFLGFLSKTWLAQNILGGFEPAVAVVQALVLATIALPVIRVALDFRKQRQLAAILIDPAHHGRPVAQHHFVCHPDSLPPQGVLSGFSGISASVRSR